MFAAPLREHPFLCLTARRRERRVEKPNPSASRTEACNILLHVRRTCPHSQTLADCLVARAFALPARPRRPPQPWVRPAREGSLRRLSFSPARRTA
jgi:type IV secretory pathway TraG/TraD family ATPase VirD4